MTKIFLQFIILSVALASAARVNAQKTKVLTKSIPLSYADVADLSIESTIAAHVKIRKAERVKLLAGDQLAADRKRYVITADVVALIRGVGGLPPQIRYLVDVKNDQNGKQPALKKAEMIIFGVTVPNRSGEVQLSAPDAQVPMTTELAAQVRAVLAAATREDAPPRILGVGDAFHVAGSLSGQGETQIFLLASDGRPVSLSIWREPGLMPRWAVSLGEIVDQDAGPPRPNTLLWYRLACFLPRALPSDSAAALAPDDAQIAAQDYQTVLGGLGPCKRTRVG
jgi:hypothetical protein